MNNKRGQIGLGIITMIVGLVVGLMMANFLIDEVTTARTSLSCSSASTITSGAKLLCLVVDISVPYWIIIVLSGAVGAVLIKLAIGR